MEIHRVPFETSRLYIAAAVRVLVRVACFAYCLLLTAPLVTSQDIDPRDRDFWNRKFNDPSTPFRHEASRLLMEAIRDRGPGLAIDLGMGEGRNAVYLAQRGWQTTGVDLSDVAVAQAKKRAIQIGVKLDAITDGLDHFVLGHNQWDLIVLFYMHAWYHGAKPQSVRRLHEALKPGGLLVIEGFAGKEKFMFQPNELLHDFGDLRIRRYEDLQDEADWAPGHKSQIVRLVAEKVQ
jgi:SAM-dependent methyltransferase